MTHTRAEYLDALRTARDFLHHVCRYQYLHGEDEAFHHERPSASDIILFARLERQLRRLNPERSESELHRASRALHFPAPANLVTAQRRLHATLFQKKSQGDPGAVRYFDLERAGNNDLLIVERFHVLGGAAARHTIDLAVFVNGIPLALLLFGEADSPNGLQAAVEQFRRLQSPYAAPHLFCFPQILLAAQKKFAAAAMAGAKERDFKPWDDASPFTWEQLRAALRLIPRRASELPTTLDVVLAGLLAPNTLLELLQNFTLFEQHGAKLARVHQYQAVRQACAHLSGPAGSTGIIWHSGNSGKAHTLAWLLSELRSLPAFVSKPIVLLTACARQRELARIVCAQRGLEAPREILSAEQLVPGLRRASGRVLMLAPEIFQQALGGMTETQKTSSLNDEAFVLLLDEISRAGSEDLLFEWRQAFPNAEFLAFTAHAPLRNAPTPLVHGLTPAQALHRGYLLPAKLEPRVPRLHHQLKPDAPSSSPFAGTPLAARRLDALVEDLCEHFTQEISSNACKGLVLAANSQEAARYFQALEKKLGACVALLLPKPQPHEKTLAALYRRFAPRDELTAHWRDPHNPLALLVLADHMTPELSTPALQALYIDRPLSGYELLHALALVQTPHSEDKLFGLMVDYYGVTQGLPHELARFELERLEEVLAPRFAEQAFAELRALRRELRALFKTYPDAETTEAWLFALEAPELRRAFIHLWQDFLRLLDQLLPRLQEDFAFMQEVVWIDHVRQQAATFYFDEALAHAAGGKKVRQALEKTARERGLMRVRDMARVHDESFMQEIAAMSSLQAQVLRLQYALMEEIKKNLERDPAFYQLLHQRVSRVVIARRQKHIDDATALQQLREEALRLRAAGAFPPNPDAPLSPDAQAYWHVLARYLVPRPSARARYEELAARLLATLEPDTHIVDWTIKEDWQREMRRKIKHLLREVDCPQDLLDPLTHALMQLTKARFG